MYNGLALLLSVVFAGLCYWWGYNHGRMNGYFVGREKAKADLLYEMYGVEQ